MYTAKLIVCGTLSEQVYGVHTIEGAASASEAYKAAEKLSSDVEYMYPVYQEHYIEVWKDGILIEEKEYPECW